MKCEDAVLNIQEAAGDNPADLEWRNARDHVAACVDCRDALRAAAATQTIRDRETVAPPPALFESVMQAATQGAATTASRYGFWHGAGFGGAVAATLLVAALALGLLHRPQIGETPATPEFVIALDEARDVNVAIDAERDLQGATVSVSLSGGVRLAGFGDNREISWRTDLAQGLNQLTLPVIATDTSGGTLVVRLDHEGVQKIFRVDLKLAG